MRDLEEAARTLLPASVHRYYRQGSGDGITADEAVAAWRRYRFRPHVLHDVSTVSVETRILGELFSSPVAVAPTALQQHAHPRGEVEMATGARSAGALICVSSNTGQHYSDIAAVAGPWWAQVYVLRDRAVTAAMVTRAAAAGATAVVVTADTPIVAVKEEGEPSVWSLTPPDYLHANEDLIGLSHLAVEKARDLTPRVIGWLRDLTDLPVVVKGVVRADDAARAVEAGAAAVWVSNHGGRQLDRSIASADALGPVVQRVAGSAEVYVDGGVRDGRDVLVALALGARAVFVGRPPLWAMTANGAAGVTDLIEDMTGDLVEAMSLVGCRTLRELQRDLLVVPAARD